MACRTAKHYRNANRGSLLLPLELTRARCTGPGKSPVICCATPGAARGRRGLASHGTRERCLVVVHKYGGFSPRRPYVIYLQLATEAMRAGTPLLHCKSARTARRQIPCTTLEILSSIGRIWYLIYKSGTPSGSAGKGR